MRRMELEEALWEHRVPMMRLAMSILRHPQDAEDTVSAAIVQAFRSIGSLRDAQSFKPWVMRITANACYDLLRRKKRERAYLQQAHWTQEVFQSPAEEGLLPLLMQLPEGFSQVLTLYYYENFSTAEIARILHIPAATVRMRLTRGRRQLREMLEEEAE